MTAVTAGAVYRPSDEVVARQVAGEHLLIPVRTGLAQMDYLYTADEVGSFVYALLDGRRDGRTLARLVSEVFDVDEARALEDILLFLGDLDEAGLIEEARDPR